MAQTPLRFVGVSAARAFFFTSRILVHLLAHQARKQAVSLGHSHEKQHGEFTKRNTDISIVATCARDVWQGDNRVLTESLCWQGVYMKSPRPPQGTLPAPSPFFWPFFAGPKRPLKKMWRTRCKARVHHTSGEKEQRNTAEVIQGQQVAPC